MHERIIDSLGQRILLPSTERSDVVARLVVEDRDAFHILRSAAHYRASFCLRKVAVPLK